MWELPSLKYTSCIITLLVGQCTSADALVEGLLRMCMLAVQMQVQPGQSVALVGSSGGGKSTVVKVSVP
jgi:predicted ABC-type transport system involved in lysophospholipase L1 biosynthesis ATPase subunit